MRFNKKQKSKRAESPNVLYFQQFKPFADRDCVRYYWVLKDDRGHHIGSSNNLYPAKIDAIRNAVLMFGKEIQAGTHVVLGEEDYKLILSEIGEVEKEVD